MINKFAISVFLIVVLTLSACSLPGQSTIQNTNTQPGSDPVLTTVKVQPTLPAAPIVVPHVVPSDTPVPDIAQEDAQLSSVQEVIPAEIVPSLPPAQESTPVVQSTPLPTKTPASKPVQAMVTKVTLIPNVAVTVISPNNKPDLHITSLEAHPAPVLRFVKETIYIKIHNAGNAATKGNFTVRFWGTPSDPASGGCNIVVTDPIPAGGGAVLKCSYKWQTSDPKMVIRATVDAGNNIAESNENNNTLQKSIEVYYGTM